MPSLLYLLFYDAFSDHAFVFLFVSMYLETDLPTPQETPTQRLSMGLKTETQFYYISRARLAVGELDLDPVNFFLQDFFFLDFFFFGDWSLRTGPPPSPGV